MCSAVGITSHHEVRMQTGGPNGSNTLGKLLVEVRKLMVAERGEDDCDVRDAGDQASTSATVQPNVRS